METIGLILKIMGGWLLGTGMLGISIYVIFHSASLGWWGGILYLNNRAPQTMQTPPKGDGNVAS